MIIGIVYIVYNENQFYKRRLLLLRFRLFYRFSFGLTASADFLKCIVDKTQIGKKNKRRQIKAGGCFAIFAETRAICRAGYIA